MSFDCPECGESYWTRAVMEQHRSDRHGKVPFGDEGEAGQCVHGYIDGKAFCPSCSKAGSKVL